ncbi:MAG TPA: hypothetical protein VKJ01_07665, partial [Candidatus Solibacter sp.]|nr:hypothetical protein [Candidatus Solibacter sp.]
SPPALYVGDTGNNRVLGWKNATNFANGKPADLVVGQSDFFSTRPGGPSTAFTAGLSAPVGLAVFGGDLYVVDAGNNRVLRFRTPFSTPPDQQFPDLIVGQPNLASRVADYPAGFPTEKGIFLASNNGALQANIAFDKQGNLWLADAGNRRVLMYPASEVAKSNNFGLPATIVIGQTDFLSAAVLDTNSVSRTNQLAIPTGLAFDASGRLYVSDSDDSNNSADPLNRVLVFTPSSSGQFSSGQSASRIMGLLTPLPQGVPPPDQRTQTIQRLQIRMNSPNSIFFLSSTPGNQPVGVVDSNFSRILIFDPYEQWPDPGTATSPSAKAVVGQGPAPGIFVKPDGTQAIQPNFGNPRSSAQSFRFPTGAVFLNNELYVADSGNHRVMVLPLQTGTFGSATRLLGQDRFDSNSINLIEGREFQFVGTSIDAGLALDTTGDVPHLYVADTYNNRILGFKDLRSLKPGAAADIVIGQPDLATALCNPTNDATVPTQSSLCQPRGLVVDSSGNLYVADYGNGRVLRFPAPFAHQGQQQADLVLGRRDFFGKVTDPGPRNMAVPYGLAIVGTNGLAVSDVSDNRVLYFKFTGNGTFTGGTDNGIAATKVFGQPDFSTIVKGTADTQMNAPRHLSADSDGRIYVADTLNNRILIYDQINNTPNGGAHAALALSGLNSPEGVFVNQTTGEVWVTNTNSGTVLKYPKYDTLQFNPASTGGVNAASSTLAVVQDQFGNLVVADASNRVAFYYPPLTALNGAQFMANRALAPGVFASIFAASGSNFGTGTAKYTDLPNPVPYPKVLADIQVLVNGTPAPLTFVSPAQINFVVPMNAPTGGNAEIQVLKVSTGQLFAISGVIPMNSVSPGIFEISGTGAARQAAVINQDGVTINSATSPAKRGEVISIYATGQGFVANAPADGDIPRNGLVQTASNPRVLIGDFTDNIALQPNDPPDRSFVKFSGLSPNFPGIWQINVQIPFGVTPGQQPLLIQANSVASIDAAVTGYRTVIYVQ